MLYRPGSKGRYVLETANLRVSANFSNKFCIVAVVTTWFYATKKTIELGLRVADEQPLMLILVTESDFCSLRILTQAAKS